MVVRTQSCERAFLILCALYKTIYNYYLQTNVSCVSVIFLSFFIIIFNQECVATSASVNPSDANSSTQTSHTCNLNLCLGGGGFDCIGKKKEYIFIEIS
jgi:hypothetical protein